MLFGELSDEYWDRVKGHRRAGDALHEASEQQYERALQLDPGDNVALDRLAIMRFYRQRYEEALGLYRRLAEISPGSA